MPRTITRNFNPEGDRYAYDFGHCRFDKGWAQIDTTSDAHYYGNWANPHTRKIFIYAEGDETVIALDTDDEFVEELPQPGAFPQNPGAIQRHRRRPTNPLARDSSSSA